MYKYAPHLAVIFAALLWSIDALLRQSLYALPPLLIITIEHGVGTIIFIPFLKKYWDDIKGLLQSGWISILWISLLGGMGGTYFYTKALSYVGYIDLSIVVLLQKLQPVFAMSLAAIILKEKLSKKYILLAFLAIIGGYLVTFGKNSVPNWDDNTLIAALLALLAAFCWGSSTAIAKKALVSLHYSAVTGLRLAVTTLISLIIIIIFNFEILNVDISLNQWSMIIIIVLSSGTFALFIYYYGLNKLPASHTTLFELFWPLSAVIIDWIRNGEPLAFMQLLGAAFLLLSTTLLAKENSNE
jgi:drug/metabolite transporter (DMT)-like permease